MTLPGRLTLHLVRHAPTVPNAERRYPHPGEDAPLSGEGQALALALQGRWPDLESSQVVCSPSRRTQETATLAGFAAPLLSPALGEAHFGVMAGHTWAELEERYGHVPRAWIEGLSDPDSSLGPPEGETGRQFHARLGAWLDTLPPAGTVLAVTHAGTALGLLRLTVGLRAAVIAPAGHATLHRDTASGAWWLSALGGPPTVQADRTDPLQAD